MTGIVECKNSTATSPASSWLGHFGSARIIFFFTAQLLKGWGAAALDFSQPCALCIRPPACVSGFRYPEKSWPNAHMPVSQTWKWQA